MDIVEFYITTTFPYRRGTIISTSARHPLGRVVIEKDNPVRYLVYIDTEHKNAVHVEEIQDGVTLCDSIYYYDKTANLWTCIWTSPENLFDKAEGL